MRVPVSWLGEFVDIAGRSVEELDAALVRQGLEVEAIHSPEVTGPVVVGRVDAITELKEFRKPIRHCLVDVGENELRSIVCGARNFTEGDYVAVALPGAVLVGGFVISSRQTYGHVSDGMICSEAELGLETNSEGIIVLADHTSDEFMPGTDIKSLLGLDETVFELAVTPNMSHCLSLRGVAREVSHALGVTFHDDGLGDAPAVTDVPPHEVRVEDPSGCDRFVGRAIRAINASASSPWWLKTRLLQIGMRPISLTVDATNYLMHSLGQPMHAFDLAKVQGSIVVRAARSGETLRTLDGVERKLDPDDLVIADDSGPVGLAGVMGGQFVEVSAQTTDVLIECAHWDPAKIARTIRRHKLPSEAGKRFERGVDSALAPVAAERAVQLLQRHASGTLDERVLDLDFRAPILSIELDIHAPARIVGVPYDTKAVRERLIEVGCTVTEENSTLRVVPPSWRPDVTDPADLVEEVARLEGYDNIPPVLPQTPASPGLSGYQRRLRLIARSLAESGLVEILSYPFVATATHDAMGLNHDDARRRACNVANPLSTSESELRTSLLPGLFSTAVRNRGRGMKNVALFEIGKVFLPKATDVSAPRLSVNRRPTPAEFAMLDAVVPDQPRYVAAVWTGGEVDQSGWWGDGRAADWSDAVQAARLIGEVWGVELQVQAAHHAPWHPGRCAQLRTAEDVVVGYAGELHPAVCIAMELPPRSCAMELNIDLFPGTSVRLAPSISTFPPALLDVALVVDEGVASSSVAQALESGIKATETGQYIERIELFDLFTGPQVGVGKKSLTFSLSFRSPDRTLTTSEVTAARDTAVAEVAQRYGAELRT